MADRDEQVDRRDGRAADRQVPIRLVALAVLVLLVVLFGVANRDDVPVDYLVDEASIPLVWVILASLVAGALIDRLGSFVRARRRRS